MALHMYLDTFSVISTTSGSGVFPSYHSYVRPKVPLLFCLGAAIPNVLYELDNKVPIRANYFYYDEQSLRNIAFLSYFHH